ncbi:MAG: glycosyltransferase [Muribaculaceae bacterium]|nr:glycosyltransferase [Muribaculaceae bacterium]
MNIAFFTERECCPTIGGTERTTSLVAGALRDFYGHRIFSIFNKPVESSVKRFEFEKSICIGLDEPSAGKLAEFITDNDISLVINQGDFYFCEFFHNVVSQRDLSCRQFFVFHFSPGSGEEALISFKETFKLWKRNKFSSEAIKVILYPLYYRFATRRFRQHYRNVEKMADRIVLLSDSFKSVWMDYAHPGDNGISAVNFEVIPNALTFDHFASEAEIEAKEHRILIVSRFDERQKKLSKALRIWKEISQKEHMKDWHLDIVGDGEDRTLYEKIVKKHKIERIHFHGRRNPEPFYMRSSLFMMTSDYEGFGMTIIEASQYGVVPFAFNTYASLEDILINDVNGYIIEPNDFSSYESKLIDMANNPQRRSIVALNAVKNSRRFALDIIAAQWQNLISNS